MPASRGVALVTGATGYVGGRLVPALLEAGWAVRCLARTPSKLSGHPWVAEIEVVEGDTGDPGSLGPAMEGVTAAFYLVHSMGGDEDFEARDRLMAATFRDAAAGAGVNRIVYMGGLGDDDDPKLSTHLRSRIEVGRVLAEGPVPVTELRAAMVIGSGSASFEMLRNLVDVLPAMVTPKWVHTPSQPVAIRDVLHWLVAAADAPAAAGRVLEMGGPDVVTYAEVMACYAEVAGLPRRLVIPVPLLTPRLSSLWIGLVTPLPVGLARPLIDSLSNEVVVRDRDVRSVLPHDPLPLKEALAVALRRVADLDVATTWASADLRHDDGPGPADPSPLDPGWSGGTLLVDHQSARTGASTDALFASVAGIGGRRGWLAHDWLWQARGGLDRLVGGVGLRRGRRHPDQLRVGDALDFWRVEDVEVGRRIRLRAEMRLPGRAWLEWTVAPDGSGAALEQKAMFVPRGLWGRLYWYSLLPFHSLIFGRLAERLAERAEQSEAGTDPSPAAAGPDRPDGDEAGD